MEKLEELKGFIATYSESPDANLFVIAFDKKDQLEVMQGELVHLAPHLALAMTHDEDIATICEMALSAYKNFVEEHKEKN